MWAQHLKTRIVPNEGHQYWQHQIEMSIARPIPHYLFSLYIYIWHIIICQNPTYCNICISKWDILSLNLKKQYVEHNRRFAGPFIYLSSVLRKGVVSCLNTILCKAMDMGTALDQCDMGCNSDQRGISGTMEAYLLKRMRTTHNRHHKQEFGRMVYLLKINWCRRMFT